MPGPTDGTVTPYATATPETREAMLDAVREARGERALRPTETLAEAEADVRAGLVVPEWHAGREAADVAADVLRDAYSVEAPLAPTTWALYTEAARRLGFAGPVPVPTLPAGLGVGRSRVQATGPSASA